MRYLCSRDWIDSEVRIEHDHRVAVGPCMLKLGEHTPKHYSVVDAYAPGPDAWPARAITLYEHHAFFFVGGEILRHIYVALRAVSSAPNPKLFESKVLPHSLPYPSLH